MDFLRGNAEAALMTLPLLPMHLIVSGLEYIEALTATSFNTSCVRNSIPCCCT